MPSKMVALSDRVLGFSGVAQLGTTVMWVPMEARRGRRQRGAATACIDLARRHRRFPSLRATSHMTFV
jgi:hypothetical protein